MKENEEDKGKPVSGPSYIVASHPNANKTDYDKIGKEIREKLAKRKAAKKKAGKK